MAGAVPRRPRNARLALKPGQAGSNRIRHLGFSAPPFRLRERREDPAAERRRPRKTRESKSCTFAPRRCRDNTREAESCTALVVPCPFAHPVASPGPFAHTRVTFRPVAHPYARRASPDCVARLACPIVSPIRPAARPASRSTSARSLTARPPRSARSHAASRPRALCPGWRTSGSPSGAGIPLTCTNAV